VQSAVHRIDSLRDILWSRIIRLAKLASDSRNPDPDHSGGENRGFDWAPSFGFWLYLYEKVVANPEEQGHAHENE
jgi:hypothetical protein